MSVTIDHISRYVCRILINRPEKRNAINLEVARQLQEAIYRFEQNDEYHVAILAGAGGNFCSGYDLNEMVDVRTKMPRLEQIERLLWPLGTRLSRKKLTVAAIEGHAAGFGFELALKCDFRIAENDSRMGFLNRRLSIPIMSGGTVILPHLIGQSRASVLVATGRAQLAPASLQYGIIESIADVGCAQGTAVNFARSLAKFDQVALLNDLMSTVNNDDEGIQRLLRLERKRSLEFLRTCRPLEVAAKFLTGELCRHGNTNLGNLIRSDPDVSL